MQRWRDIAVLVVLALAAAVLAPLHLRLRVDLENRAMKSQGTPEAAAMAERNRVFGAEHTALVLLEPRTREVAVRPDDPAVLALTRALGSLAGVTHVAAVPRPNADCHLLAVEIDAARAAGTAPVVRDVQRVARELAPVTFHVAVSGQPVGEVAIADAIRNEQMRIVPAIAVALFALLWLRYRRARLAFAVMLPSLLGIVAIGALQVGLGHQLDPVSALLHPVLLTVGVAGAVHLVEGVLLRVRLGQEPGPATRNTVRDLVLPTALTCGTTVAGFASLASSAVPAITRFGLLAASGVVLVVLLAFALIPAWLRLWIGPAQVRALRQRGALAPPASPLLAVWLRKSARPLVVAAGVLALLGAAAWSQLRVDTDPLRVLPEEHAFRHDTGRFAARLGGIETFDLLLPPPAAGNQGRLARAAGLLRLQAGLLADPQVVTLIGAPRISAEGHALVRALLAPGSSEVRERLFSACEARARQLGWPGAVATGPTVQILRDSAALVRGQLGSLASTLVVLLLALWAGFRSLPMALLGLVPNLIACLLLYGGLAALGQPLSVATAMIGAVMLGLVVDDSVHFLHRFLQARRAGSSRISAVARALHRTGSAVTVTSLVLAAGFAVGLLGDLTTTREFGAAAAAAILLALLADLGLTPAILLCREPAPRVRQQPEALPCPESAPTT
ncbi:MAG: MMPL family transporter [Planctomycetes bacterium]|nr:MMPL family transporter [Planctomycetota bacterium]